MILIGGTSIDIDTLPFCEVMEYTVEPKVPILTIKLKTVAKSDTCLGVYLSSDLQDLWLSDDVKEKTTYFSSDEELLSLLEAGETNDEEEPEDEEVQEDEVVFSTPEKDFQLEDVYTEHEEADTDVADILLSIPNISEDTTSLNQQLLNKQRIIEQKDAQVAELKESMNEIYKVQESQLLEMKESYENQLKELQLDIEEKGTLVTKLEDDIRNTSSSQESLLFTMKEDFDKEFIRLQKLVEQKDELLKEMNSSMEGLNNLKEVKLAEAQSEYERKLNEANEKIVKLESEVNKSGVPTELVWFLKYATYCKNYKSILREGLTDEELAYIGKPTSDIFICASGAGDSLHSMLRNVKSLMDTSKDIVVIDFSNDYFMNTHYRIKTKDVSLLLNDNVPVEALVRKVGEEGNVEIIPTPFYNDIALLSLDWVKILKKVLSYAKGKTIIFLFNNINSFSVRYTVSKLSTIGQLFIFAKSNPIILSTLFGDIAFIPENRFKVVATDYIDVVKGVLEQISQKHEVTAFKEKVNWSKLGVK